MYRKFRKEAAKTLTLLIRYFPSKKSSAVGVKETIHFLKDRLTCFPCFSSPYWHPMMSLFPDHLSCWVKLSSREKMTPLGSKGTILASPISDNRLTSFVALSFTSFGQRDVRSISIISISLGKSFSKPGWLSLRLGCPLGRPLIPFGPPGTLVFKLGLIKPLGWNGVTQASLGMIVPPSGGVSCPPCTSWISLMFDGAATPPSPFLGFLHTGFSFFLADGFNQC